VPPNPASDDHPETANRQPGFPRRPVLKALGVGAALAFGSGTAAAENTGSDSGEIDPYYGYATPDAAEIAEETAFDPDHVVELHVRAGVEYDPGPPKDTEHGPIFHFDPVGLAVDPGDVIQFTYTTPDHTITAYHPAHGFQRRVPETVPPFSSPIVNAGGAWLYEFTEEGLYDLYCGPHHVLGMTMRIVVGDLDPADVPAYEDTFEGAAGPPPLLAPFGKDFLEAELDAFSEPQENRNAEWVWLTPREVLDADALDPDTIQDEGVVSLDEVLADIDRIETDAE
jgi:plastocyanin